MNNAQQKSKQFNIYLAYPTYRGDEDIHYKMTKRYCNIGTEIRAYLLDWEKMDGLPKCNMYNPADHELFVDTAHFMELLSGRDILTVNRDIIGRCDLVILYGNTDRCVKGTLLEEVKHAKISKIPIFTLPDLSPIVIDTLKLAITIITKSGDINEV